MAEPVIIDGVAYVPVAGLLVPATLVPRIVAAMRGLYPSVTEGITDDDAAVRAVLKHWVTTTLSTFETAAVAISTADQIEALKAQAEEEARLAREKAEADAGTITEPAPAPTEPSI